MLHSPPDAPSHGGLCSQILQISVMAINRDAAVWGDDCEKFIPERWLDPSRLPQSDKTTSGFSGNSTFNEGPRMCLGYRLGATTSGRCFGDCAVLLIHCCSALFEFKVVLSTLVKQFKLTEADVKIETRLSITLQPYVAGQRGAGPQLPVRLQLVDSD